MPIVTVSVPKRQETDSGVAISASIQIGTKRKDVYLRLPNCQTANNSDAFLAASLLPAMREGDNLRIEGPVSARILTNTPTIQQIFHRWDTRLKCIEVEAEARKNTPGHTGRRVGCFFSAGIDSFYTLLKHEHEITDLIFVHGFDIPLHNSLLRSRVSDSIRAVAAKFRKRVLEVETNLREFSDEYVSWNFLHGAALASVGLLLAPEFSRIYIAASCSYADLFPWGSHPLVDPLWSTETMEIVHDGCEATRAEKAAYIASNETAVNYLRVCWENPGGAYNCGRCEKCVRTMAILRAVGILAKCPTFESPLDLRALANREVKEIHRAHLQAALDAAEFSGNDSQLVQALRCCLSGRRHHGIQGIARRILGKFSIH